MKKYITFFLLSLLCFTSCGQQNKSVEQTKEVENKTVEQTTKKDKINHGYGLENIKYVVFKYNGKVTTEYENGCFSLKIEL